MLFANHNALISHSAEDIQKSGDAFVTASSKFGLKINIKTEVMFQSNCTTASEEDISVDDGTLNPGEELTYLNSIKARHGNIEAELQKIILKASMSFGRLRERLWNNHNVYIRVKRKIFRVIIPSTILFGAETWTVYRSHVKKIYVFMRMHPK